MKTNLVFSFGLVLLLSACGAPHGPGVGLALEARPDVFRNAWFTGRWPNDVHFTSLSGSSGQLTELGRYYLSLPYAGGSSACGGTNVAQGRPAASLTTENGGTPASATFDGNSGIRWSSAFSDPQWVQVDLGSSRAVCQVVLRWETAYGRAFQIEVSNDARTWTPVDSTSSGTGGTQTLQVSGTGRYVRLAQRGTGYEYSLFESRVYGAPRVGLPCGSSWVSPVAAPYSYPT